jgi:hypothetical protein
MKRSVAVLGHTPQFVRWSIDHACDIRAGDDTTSPDSTFRQLRGVREFSLGEAENRVVDSVCIHRSASSDHPDLAMGFTESEVLAVFGGRDAIETCCSGCKANTNSLDSDDPLWAGCYGWLTADGSSLASLSGGEELSDGQAANESDDGLASPTEDMLVKEIGFAIQMLNLGSLIETNFAKTVPAWFSFWQKPTLTVPQLLLLEKVFSTALRRHESSGDPDFVDDLLRFIDALTLCHRHSLKLNVELVPRGYSDGVTWTTFAHCPRCHHGVSSPEETWQICPACGHESPPSGERKSKVLGLRPYVNLERVLGEARTVSLLKRYEQTKV